MKQQALNVFLIGKAYSGSTILGKDLNMYKHVFYAGEVGRLPLLRVKYGYYSNDAECMNCYLSDLQCSVFNAKNNIKISAHGPSHALNTLRALTHQQVIVDGSKYVDWLNIYEQENNKQIATKVILVVKNPLYYIQSCDVRGVGQLWQEANAWRDTYYDAYRTINRLGISSLVIRNEDYKKDKSNTLKRVIEFLDIEDKIVASPVHALGGNAGAYQEEFGKKFLKDKYRSLHDKQLAQEKLAMNPAIASSIHRLDIMSARKKAQYLQILHDTPMLFDIANMMGYKAKDFR